MGHISEVEHQGKRILIQDFANMRPGEEFQQGIAEATVFIAAQLPKSVLSVFDVTQAFYDAEVLVTLKEFTKHNEPYIKASAVVGVAGVAAIAVMAVSRFSGRTFKTFDDRVSAMDWLVAQP